MTRRFKNTVVSRIFVLKMDANLNLFGLRLMAMYSVVSLAYIIWGICGSLLPPFFPNEAMSKGASISQSGFVFGVFSLLGLYQALYLENMVVWLVQDSCISLVLLL